MKTKKYYANNLGMFSPSSKQDFEGYVEIHDSSRYSKASSEELEIYCQSRLALVRNAARLEFAERRLSDWQQK